jgi:hypothetical protein
MKTLEAPNGYELLESRDFYSYYLSHEDKGIMGGITLLESGRVQLDLFKDGVIIPVIGKTLAAALEFSGDLEAIKELGKL